MLGRMNSVGGVVVVVAASPGRPIGVERPLGAFVVAADGGAEHARLLGLEVDLLVGDLDSVSAETLAHIERVERHPSDKDATDLELALSAAARLEPERILVLGGASGRLDHLFAILLLLAAEQFAPMTIDAQLGSAAVHVIRGERTIDGRIDDVLSLFAVHGPAYGITTSGLAYPLCGETLAPGSSRGVSNLFSESQARISVERGVVVAVRPNGSVTAGSSGRPPS